MSKKIRKKEKQKISRSENMARIKRRDTKVELLLRHELWQRALRYRNNDSSVFGTPDIVFKGKKIAIFCDSEFWHGKKYLDGEIPKTNTEFWKAKLKKNIERDREVSKVLNGRGWTVLRYWEKEIKKDVSKIADEIEAT